MLHQLHWEYRDGTTDMRAQRDINSVEDARLFVADAHKTQPLPDDATWLMCNEQSRHFVLAKV